MVPAESNVLHSLVEHRRLRRVSAAHCAFRRDKLKIGFHNHRIALLAVQIATGDGVNYAVGLFMPCERLLPALYAR